MPYKNPEKRKSYLKKWRKQNPEKVNSYTRKWRSKNPKKVKQYGRNSVDNVRARRHRDRMIVLRHYGGLPPKCACCGETELMFLTIDHINGGGRQHRIAIKNYGLTRWLIKNKLPKGFQILCMNCNLGSFLNKGTCPHKK